MLTSGDISDPQSSLLQLIRHWVIFHGRHMTMLAVRKAAMMVASCLAVQGCGFVWPTTIGKLELNICKVLKADRHDKLLSNGFGLQVGFSPAI